MITIVTPTFNAEAQVSRTLASLADQKVAFEHIVVDGESTDGTLSKVGEYTQKLKTRVTSEADDGVYDAVRKGFECSTGDILAWLNAGDGYFPWTLAVVEQIFAACPSVEWIIGHPCWYVERVGYLYCSPYTPVFIKFLIQWGWHDGRRLECLQQESMFWRRSLWNKSNGSEILRGNGKLRGLASDYRLWRRFASYAPLHTVRSPLAYFSFTQDQLTQRRREEYFADAGVDRAPLHPNKYLSRLFRLLSCLCASRTIAIHTGL